MNIFKEFDILLSDKTIQIDKIPKYLYHATYKPLFKNIKLLGLKGGVRKNWEDSKSNLVYLSFDPDVAESYAETSDEVPEEWLDKIIILEINTEGLDFSKFSSDNNVLDDDGTLVYDGIIPINNIKIFNNL